MTAVRPERSNDDGFTLVELLIAVFIMSVAGIAIGSAMETLGYANSNHRALGSLDGDLRSYAEAVKHHAELETTINSAITSSSASVTVPTADAALIPAGSLEIAIDGELIAATHTAASQTITLVTRGDRNTIAASHGAGAPLTPVYNACPGRADAAVTTPFTLPEHVATVAVTRIDYWIPDAVTSPNPARLSGSWKTQGDCTSWVQSINGYTGVCAQYAGSTALQLPECWPGLIRVTVTVTGDSIFNGTQESTSILVRRGNR